MVAEEGGKVHILAGTYREKTGAMTEDYVKPLYLDVEVRPGVEWSLETEREDTLFVYIVQGEAAFGPSGES